jgi:hypothetical protein
VGFSIAGVGAKIYIEDTTVEGSAAAASGTGITSSVAGGTYRINNGCNFAACLQPVNLTPGTLLNRGTLIANGATTPVAVSFPDLRSTDDVSLERVTTGGTPSALLPLITKTPGTGFSFTGAALDTSNYAWRIAG